MIHQQVTIDPRFRGPKQSGNGGYVCGLVGAAAPSPVSVRLRQPPPLETPLDIVAAGDKIEMRHGENVIAEAVPATVEVTVPQAPDDAGVLAAHKTYEARASQHPLAECFVCGPKRDEGDGLRIFSGPVPDSTVSADYWTPGDDLADDADGLIAPEFLWAALDCPSFFGLRTQKLCLLGSLAAEIQRRPKPGERLIAMGWGRSVDGRKHYADSALIDESGAAIAVANAVWIELKTKVS